ncbi:MAG: hypothetical protein JST58_12835 [Bacteroidetes bacterium]|nr:hypothetical protein [Bacteroidota bacterium]
MATNEINAQRRAGMNNQKTKKPKTNNKRKGKARPSKEMNHHFSGYRKALAQANKKIMATTMLQIITTRLVSFRNVGITGCKLQILLVGSPL